ncbi:hypothetical protein H2O64_08135 [Kordia sp. YSTF-M3]|uniref:C2 domain-containing protein n=1 Tax=Kordia aestuariivivens TaxID=2759037 RepID=A0ABR7Q7W8_9FLAO|nr:hypothetical protein [Kordia aestuariivivens]MBC8754640.1 hypothetical protein [Kordia aestuariivivens]
MNTKNTILKTEDDVTVTKERMSAIETIINSTTKINPFPSPMPCYESFTGGVSSINDITLGIIKDDFILPPAASAILVDEVLIVGLLLTAKTSKALHEMEDFQMNYQLTLNDYGLPQLNIYVLYSETNSEENPYWDNSFQITFDRNITPEINLEELTTIQVFLQDEDPRTSRGTVTTVKRPM